MRGVGKLGRFLLISAVLMLGFYLGMRIHKAFSSRSEARRVESGPPERATGQRGTCCGVQLYG